MESWSVDQVCNWLRQRNLEELVPKFRGKHSYLSFMFLLVLPTLFWECVYVSIYVYANLRLQ